MTPPRDQHRATRLRRHVAVLGLATALGTGALLPSASAAAASPTSPTSAAARTTVAQQDVRQAPPRRAVAVRQAPRGRLASPVATRTSPVAATKKAPEAVAPKDDAAIYQQRLLVLVNQERAKKGLRPLVREACGDAYAKAWAASMAARGVMEHQQLRPLLGACKARTVGENVAFGNVTPDRMMEMWMNSPGHRTNILRPEMTHLGLGTVMRADGRVYGCQLFLALK